MATSFFKYLQIILETIFIALYISVIKTTPSFHLASENNMPYFYFSKQDIELIKNMNNFHFCKLVKVIIVGKLFFFKYDRNNCEHNYKLDNGYFLGF